MAVDAAKALPDVQAPAPGLARAVLVLRAYHREGNGVNVLGLWVPEWELLVLGVLVAWVGMLWLARRRRWLC